MTEIIFDRKTQGRFPEIKELVAYHIENNIFSLPILPSSFSLRCYQQKQLIRDVIAPGLSLGHSDSKVKSKIDIAHSGSGLKAKAKAKTQDEPSEEYEECEECADGSCEQCTKDEFKFDFSQFE